MSVYTVEVHHFRAIRDADVAGFAKVFGKIVDFDVARSIKVLDQFPIAFADTACRAIMVIVRIVPIQGIAV